MRFFVAILGLFSTFFVLAGDFNPSGTWQGVMIRKGSTMEKGTILYAEFKLEGEYITGLTREEKYDTEYFSTKRLNGAMTESGFTFQHVVEVKGKKGARMKWCRASGELSYDPVKGYLKGTFVSTDCRRVIGDIILYRADFEMTTEETLNVSQIWFNSFVRDYKDGLSAPEVRKLERDNFVFEPIFFDYDKSDIRPEHEDFLRSMVKIVKGHSDLRIRVTGHTDSDGSHAYNDSLSMRRSKSIIRFFTSNGLDEDRIVIDFKGEREPVDTNTTPEGKQRNRRVDFAFISGRK